MANILDIFRTQTGAKLLEQSNKLTNLELERLQNAFVYTFPALLNVYLIKGVSNIVKPENLIELIESGDLTEFGKKETEYLLTIKEQKTILEFSGILAIEIEAFKNILHISTAVLATIISEMNRKQENEFSGIVKTLAGINTKYNEDFLKVLIKNPDDPNFIGSREEISLGRDTNDEDSSILGGYAGGR